MSGKEKTPTAAADASVSDEEIKTMVYEELHRMVDKIIGEEIEKEIGDRISGKKISAKRRTRIFKKVIADVQKSVPELLDRIAAEQLKTTNDDEEQRVSEDIRKDITDRISSLVHKSMEKAIADEIFEKVKIEKLTRTPTVEPQLGTIGVRHAQVLMVFLFLAISYAQRSDLSVAIVAMTDQHIANPNFQDFDWNESIIGLLLSSFYWGYFLSQIPGGILAEKIAPKELMGWAMLFCSTASLFVPAATILGDWVGLYILKTIQGISQAAFIPAVYVFTARWIPPKEKSRLFTPAFGGMQMGTVVGMPISGLLCAGFTGWPSVFYFSAIVGYAWSAAWIFLAANSPAVHRSISREEQLYIEGSFGFEEITIKGVRKTIPWKPILSSVPFWALMIAHFGQNWAFFTLFTKMPSYINFVLKVDITWNSFLSALSYLIGWILIVIFGFLSSYIHERGLVLLETERKLWNSLAFYGGSISFILLGALQTKRLDLAIFLLTVIVATNSGVYNGFFSNHADLSPNYVGILMGLTNTFGNLAALLAPIFVSQVVTDPTNVAQWSIVFYTASGIMIVSNTIYVVFGSAEIQPWNTPTDLHLQLEEDDIPSTAMGSSRRRRKPFFVSMATRRNWNPSPQTLPRVQNVLNLEPTNVINCISKGKSESFDCRNHIRVIQPMKDGSRLYICGTNAHSPRDWVIYSNLTTLPRHEHVPGISSGLGKCPFDPNDNATAIWVEKGNPGDMPALYSGTIADFTKADTVIFRGDLYNLTTGRVEYPFKRTLKYDSKWLDKPDFVGSYDVGQYVFFFFRETAVEYINCGKSVYSRVARICKKDTGGKNILNQNWATYLKARLNCSIPGEFPFYFNEIQSVYKVDGDDNKFYGVFTTSTTGLMGSAICTFTLEDIEKAFNGKFKEQATSSSAWLPVLTNKVPEPRPGQCVNDTETLPDSVLNFIRSHPLMDEAVAHKDNKPVYYKRDLLFTRLVVDPLQYDVFNKRYHYTVYYAGTNLGFVYKVVQWHDEGGESHSALLDIFDVTQGLPIRTMEISRKHKSLYVASDESIHQIDIVMCNHRYDSCLRCVRDPYCGWDKDSSACKPYQAGLLQDVGNTSRTICDTSVARKKYIATYGESVPLNCFSKMPEVLRSFPITWYHYSKENGKHVITYNNDKYVSTSEGGIVVLEVSESDAGLYECWLAGSLLCVYNMAVDTHRCSPPGKSVDYHKVYSDWCHEFQKYKNAMKTWERKKEQCMRQNETSIANQNMHTNEILPRNFR